MQRDVTVGITRLTRSARISRLKLCQFARSWIKVGLYWQLWRKRGSLRTVESGASIRGKLKGRHIELEESVDDLEGDVEVFVRAARESTPRAPDVLEVIAAMPTGNREKSEIDAELAHDRDSWDGRA